MADHFAKFAAISAPSRGKRANDGKTDDDGIFDKNSKRARKIQEKRLARAAAAEEEARKYENEEEDEDEEEEDEVPLPEVDPEEHSNPLLEVHRLWTESAPKDMARVFDPRLSTARRIELLGLLPTLAQRKYAWAIPDARALGLLYTHGPIVEVAAGKGYWGYALQRFAVEAKQAGIGHWKPDDLYKGFDAAPYIVEGENLAERNKRAFEHELRRLGLDPEVEARRLAAMADGNGSDDGEEGDGGDDDDDDDDTASQTGPQHPSQLKEGEVFDYRKWRNKKRGGRKRRQREQREQARQRALAKASAAASFQEDRECPPWLRVNRAGPDVAAEFPEHTLFLCYPDEGEAGYVPAGGEEGEEDDEDGASGAGDDDSSAAAAAGYRGKSVGLRALLAYRGNTVIVVGESFAQTAQGGNPWGRSAMSEFQQELASQFHCVVQVPLPTWPGTVDTLSVWRRTTLCSVVDSVEAEEAMRVAAEERRRRAAKKRRARAAKKAAKALARDNSDDEDGAGAGTKGKRKGGKGDDSDDSDSDEEDDEDDEDESDEDDTMKFNFIPAPEQIPLLRAAPVAAHWADVPLGASGLEAVRAALRNPIAYSSGATVGGRNAGKAREPKAAGKDGKDRAAGKTAAAGGDDDGDLSENDDFGLGVGDAVAVAAAKTGLKTGVPVVSQKTAKTRVVMKAKSEEDAEAEFARAAAAAAAKKADAADKSKDKKKDKKKADGAETVEPVVRLAAVPTVVSGDKDGKKKKETLKDLGAESLRLIMDDDAPKKSKKEKKAKKDE